MKCSKDFLCVQLLFNFCRSDLCDLFLYTYIVCLSFALFVCHVVITHEHIIALV